MGIQVEVWGPYASFNRPELKVERVSYDVMTPSAARGLLEAIYWHPGLKWIVDRIYVMNPIRFVTIRRNEVSQKIPASSIQKMMAGGKAPPALYTPDSIQQRASLVLRDVRYVIEAHFELTEKASLGDNAGKFQDIMKRRLEQGKCFHQPCFGCREFPAHFRRWSGGEVPTAYPNEDRELGYMLYDMDYSNPRDIKPQFFRASLRKGVLDVQDCEVVQ